MATDTRHPAAPAAQLLPGRRARRGFPHHALGDAGRVPEAISEPRVSPVAAVAARDRRYRRMLAYADLVAATIALFVTLSALGHDAVDVKMLLLAPFIIIASKVQGLYDRDELTIRKSTLDEAPQLFQLATTFTLVLWLLDGVLIEGGLGKEQVLFLWAALFGTTMVARIAARRIAAHRSAAERCLFIGDAASYERLKSKIGDADRVEFVGRMSLQRIARRGARTHDTEELTELIGWANAHRIVMEAETLPAEEMMELIRAAKSVGTRVSLVPRVFDVIGTSVVFDELNGMTVLGVRRFGLTRSSRRLKRAFDLFGALVLLLAAAPVFAAIALAIKLDTRGPVLFRQTRIGRNGVPFRICKFRTMVADAESLKAELVNEASGGMFKIADDPRITRVGRLLRRTSLDELPQLLNVVGGSMSLVGPRPLIADEDERVTGYDRHRLQLTPGMTGHWQVLGSSRVPMPEMLKIDYLYVAGWSLWSDMKILLRTVPYMLARRGL
jgi:exopolysaccharide biosynthesis polyprenyl glycosylphosphotransferase